MLRTVVIFGVPACNLWTEVTKSNTVTGECILAELEEIQPSERMRLNRNQGDSQRGTRGYQLASGMPHATTPEWAT